VLLGIFPLIAKFVIGRLKRRRIYKGYKRPAAVRPQPDRHRRGRRGLVSAYIARRCGRR
jgi:hypothetical protein